MPDLERVVPTGIHADINPFVADLSDDYGDGDYKSGYIRIEPPFIPGEAMLKDNGEFSGVELVLWAANDKATLLSYKVLERESEMGNRWRVVNTTQGLLGDLGRLANREAL
jgi:hypothetical protein